MNIEGLDYNTQREKLVMPEYGREIQKMVEYAVALPDKEERQRCAESIIEVMARMTPQGHDSVDYEQKLWDHLAIISGFKLDIDWPHDVSGAKKITTKPEPMAYPMARIPVRHYGTMMFEAMALPTTRRWRAIWPALPTERSSSTWTRSSLSGSTSAIYSRSIPITKRKGDNPLWSRLLSKEATR